VSPSVVGSQLKEEVSEQSDA